MEKIEQIVEIMKRYRRRIALFSSEALLIVRALENYPYLRKECEQLAKRFREKWVIKQGKEVKI